MLGSGGAPGGGGSAAAAVQRHHFPTAPPPLQACGVDRVLSEEEVEEGEVDALKQQLDKQAAEVRATPRRRLLHAYPLTAAAACRCCCWVPLAACRWVLLGGVLLLGGDALQNTC